MTGSTERDRIALPAPTVWPMAEEGMLTFAVRARRGRAALDRPPSEWP